MTYDGGKPHRVGDRGQRYEVRYKDTEGNEHVLGWSEKLKGAESFAKGITLHPSWHSPRIIDRRRKAEELASEAMKDIDKNPMFPKDHSDDFKVE